MCTLVMTVISIIFLRVVMLHKHVLRATYQGGHIFGNGTYPRNCYLAYKRLGIVKGLQPLAVTLVLQT